MFKNIRIGTISSVNKTEGKASVYYEGYDEATTDYFDVIDIKGQLLKKGDDVLVTHFQEKPGDGIIIGKIHEGEFQEENGDDILEEIKNVKEKIEKTFKRIRNIEEDVSKKWQEIYPVGSIYLSLEEDFDPNHFIGGEWVKLKDRFLIGTGKLSTGAVGGEEKHLLTINEMPRHKHLQESHSHSMGNMWSDGSGSVGAYTMANKRKTKVRNTSSEKPLIDFEGGNEAHNNMPPYLAVNMWRRIG